MRWGFLVLRFFDNWVAKGCIPPHITQHRLVCGIIKTIMRKLNIGETVVLKDEWNSVTKNKEVHDAVQQLLVGERLLVERSDWKTKTKPSPSFFLKKNKGKKFKVSTLYDNSGWVIERTA